MRLKEIELRLAAIKKDVEERGAQLTAEELLDQGIKPNTIRLSIGTEHIDDILADLEKGFAAVR